MTAEDPSRCGCGRPLRDDEKQCPHCERAESSGWKTKVATGAGVVATVVLTVVTKRKIKV